jgi:hypothetical protein
MVLLATSQVAPPSGRHVPHCAAAAAVSSYGELQRNYARALHARLLQRRDGELLPWALSATLTRLGRESASEQKAQRPLGKALLLAGARDSEVFYVCSLVEAAERGFLS